MLPRPCRRGRGARGATVPACARGGVGGRVGAGRASLAAASAAPEAAPGAPSPAFPGARARAQPQAAVGGSGRRGVRPRSRGGRGQGRGHGRQGAGAARLSAYQRRRRQRARQRARRPAPAEPEQGGAVPLQQQPRLRHGVPAAHGGPRPPTRPAEAVFSVGAAARPNFSCLPAAGAEASVPLERSPAASNGRRLLVVRPLVLSWLELFLASRWAGSGRA